MLRRYGGCICPQNAEQGELLGRQKLGRPLGEVYHLRELGGKTHVFPRRAPHSRVGMRGQLRQARRWCARVAGFLKQT